MFSRIISVFVAKELTRFARIFVLLVSVVGVIWALDRLVLAERIETIHVFPTRVNSEGWEHPENAVIQDLSREASLSDFGAANSATVRFSVSDEGTEEDSRLDVSMPPDDVVPELVPVAPEIFDAPINPPPAFFDEQRESLDEEESSSSMPEAFIDRARELIATIVPPARAQGAEETLIKESASTSTKPELPLVPQDLSVCSVLGTPCRIIEFSGFGVTGPITDFQVRSASVNLSFAARGGKDATTNDRLIVRVYRNGQWEFVGEAELGGEVSNARRGGYLSFAVPAIRSWADLVGTKIAVEYVRESSKDADAYLDAAWFSVEYLGDESAGVVSESAGNIATQLASADTQARKERRNILTLPDFEEIRFEHETALNGATLDVRADAAVYRALGSFDAYTLIANDTDEVQDVRVRFYASEGARVRAISRWAVGIPYIRPVVRYEAAGYFCDGGWSPATTSADTSLEYRCAATDEMRQCDALNDDGSNCLIEGAKREVGGEEALRNGWMPLDLADGTEDAGVMERVVSALLFDVPDGAVPPNVRPLARLASPLVLEPGQVVYMRVSLEVPQNTRGSLVFEAVGGRGVYGALTSEWSGSWNYRVPLVIPPAIGHESVVVPVDFSAAEESLWQHARPDGSDIRFAIRGVGELPMRLVRWNPEKRTGLAWVRVPASSSSTTIDVYYGNPEVARLPSSDEVFRTSELTPRYALVGSESQRDVTVRVVALESDVRVRVGDRSTTLLSMGEQLVVPGARTGEVIFADGPVAAAADSIGERATLAPYAYAGDVFAVPALSEGSTLSFLSAVSSANIVGLPEQQVQEAISGSVLSVPAPADRAAIIQASAPILAIHANPYDERASVYPAVDAPVYAVKEGRHLVAASADATAFTARCERGEYRAVDGRLYASTWEEHMCIEGDPLATEAVVIEPKNAPLGTIMEGSIAGAPLVPLPALEFDDEYVLTEDALAIVSVCTPEDGEVSVALTDVSGNILASSTCVARLPNPGRFVFFDPDHPIPAGTVLRSLNSSPFLAYAWVKTSPGTSYSAKVKNLLGAIASRGSGFTQAAKEFGDEEFVVPGEHRPLDVREDGSAKVHANEYLSETREWGATETPVLRFRYLPRANDFVQGVRNAFGLRQFTVSEAVVLGSDGTPEEIPVDIAYGDDGVWEARVHGPVVPGKHTLRATLSEGEESVVDEFDFYWGMLLASAERSFYAPGDPVTISIATLSETGATICDADLRSWLVTPDGGEREVRVSASGVCSGSTPSDVADYEATFRVATSGIHTLKIVRLDASGNPLAQHRINITVQEDTPYTLSRKAPLRSRPGATVPVSLTLVAKERFEGEVIERLPAGFIVADSGKASVGEDGGENGTTTTLKWSVALDAGGTVTLGYLLMLPDTTSRVYVLPQAEIQSGTGERMSEGGQWSIAVDDTGSMMLLWDAGSDIPSGWTCRSCVGEPFHRRAIRGAGSAGSVGEIRIVPSNADAQTPLYREYVIIGSVSAGEPDRIPEGAIAFFLPHTAFLPSGWSALSPEDSGSVLRGIGITGRTSAARVNIFPQSAGEGKIEEVFTNVLPARAGSAVAPSPSMLALWDGRAPVGWDALSAEGRPMFGKILRAAQAGDDDQTIFARVSENREGTISLPYADVVIAERTRGAERLLLASSLGERAVRIQASSERRFERKLRAPSLSEFVSPLRDFSGNERPEFRMKYREQGNVLLRLARRLSSDRPFEVKNVRVLSARGEEHVPVEIAYGDNGEWTLRLAKEPRQFRPGKYAIRVTMAEGSREYEDELEFYWGVLAVNSDRSVYEPGDEAEFSLAALDDAGNTICDADLELSVRAPSGVTTNVPIFQSGACGPNNVTDVPDYLGYYRVAEIGEHVVTLTHRNTAGEVVHRITDAFDVEDALPFVLTRVGPTRIYPPATYEMQLTLLSRRDFDGRLVESLPEGFIVTDTGGAEDTQFGGALRLSWGLSMRAGETRTLRYTFDAPDISPYLYILGPARLDETHGAVFEEHRTWKIASDALGEYVEKNVSFSLSSAGSWQTVDLSGSPYNVPANAVVEIAVLNSNTADERLGGVRHASSTLNRYFDIHEAEPQGVTVAVMHVQASATSSIQAYAENTSEVTFVLLGYWTSGYYRERFDQIDPNITNGTWGNINLSSYTVSDGQIVEMAVGNWNTGAEYLGGVRRLGSTLNRYANIHESEGGAGGNQGINLVTMLVKASTTNATIQGYAQSEGANNADIDYYLLGYWSQNPTGLDYSERFDDLGGPTVASTWTERALDSFSVPAKGIAEVVFANAADANLSMLIGVRTKGSTLSRTLNLHEAEAGGWDIGRMHVTGDNTASSSIEYFSEDTANDQYRLVGYWSPGNYPPDAPILNDVPFDNEKLGSSTPIFLFTASDPDGASDLVYQFQLDDDPALDTAPLWDRRSDDETGCSPNCFVSATNTADTSPFTEGTRVRFSTSTALTTGTTYYWRVRAIDVSGSNLEGEWSDMHSFTYVADTDPSQWSQTQDTQFEQGVLSNVETFGGNAVRLVSAAPTEAMIAYGEGTVQTPRYRIWDGSAWGGESSAQSVGGTIQWTVLRAAPTRNEYVLGTQDATNDVNVQIWNGSSWGNLQEVTTSVADNTNRGFDIAYETNSGDALVVYCDGDADPSYVVWNGASWSSPGSINLASANNCEWIKLASDPTSDEIILVARDTGTQYEAQVWNGSSWGNSQTLGSMSDVLHEGIAVEYEESGDQAVVAVSNGLNSNFAWMSWDGTAWSVPTTHALGDDFEWGVMKRDAGSDNMVLCYADQDDDLGIVRWDGDGWQTFQEFDLQSNIGAGGLVDGRSISCEFETTAGRDGYIMVAYSDDVNVRYQSWNGSAFSGEATISTIQDSWTVATVRAGDGKILMTAHDDVNSRYDSSSWSGSSWSAASTLENSPSVTAEPYREPHAMAARRYVSQSGTITSDPVDFGLVPNQPSWGEVLWNTTEPSGTNVLLQVLYATTTSCNVLVPDSALPGNSSGFDVSQSPLDVSGLSTSTYSKLCLRATFTSTGQSTPTLDEWSLSWERQPYLTQQAYRWYVNANSATTTDPWPVGATDLNENEPITQIYAPAYGDVLRLRMSLRNENVTLSSGGLTLKLQYAQGATCSASMTWRDVGAIGSSTAAWRGYNNASVSDGTGLSAPPKISSADVLATYEEENPSATNPNAVAPGQEAEWDWVIEHRASSSIPYCFRVITAQGELLNAYASYPQLITNSRPNAPAQEKPFDNEQLASTTPWFEFSAEDPESNTLTYEIEVDNDYDFSSPVLDRNSFDHFNEFSNIITPANKDPFTSGETVRFVPTTALTNGVTYYWRVRARDPEGANEWSDWSSVWSVTIDTSTSITTWYQTTLEQFATGEFDDAEATTTGDVVITPPFSAGTTTSSLIDFDWKTTGNAWGELSWTDNETTGDIRYRVEYFTGSSWAAIPDADLPGNSSGFGTGPVSLLSVDPTTYNQIRLRANLTNIGGTPRLTSWTVRWGDAVGQPVLRSLFDNEKTGTTTPSFTFYSADPNGDDLEYEISWSSTTDFAASTTRNSSIHAGFVNTASSTDTSPFISGDTIRFTIQQSDALVDGRTYWWRVRAKDPNGGDVWSVWSPLRSFTVDTTVVASTWYQTTKAQFDTDTLTDVETSLPGSVNITSTIREALVAYAEGTVQAPRYRLWNGSSWGSEMTAVNVADVIRFIETDAAPTRDEYVLGTQGSTGGIDVQVYDGNTNTWGNKVRVSTASNLLRRGFDVAYETNSGDAMVVACNGTEALYRVWNGTSWSATTTLNLSVSANCEWVRLASDPTSDEILLVVRDATTGAVDYEALVWNGSAWGNSATFGSQATANNEGIAVQYEESGNQAIVVVSNGANNNFIWNAWNGSAWSGTNVVTLGNDFAGGRIARDAGTDNMALCYIDIDADIGYALWNGSAWGTATEFEALGNSANGRPVTCEYETLAGRDGYLMIPYSDTTQAEYVFWDGATLSGATILTTITDSWELRSVRTGDGNIMVVAYDDANTEYDFTYWNGASWSSEQVLEPTSIATLAPATVPIDISARRYPEFNSGAIVSSPIVFSDGSGPKWDYVTWSTSTPGASEIRMQVEYLTATGSWALIPNADIPGNNIGATTSPIDLGELNTSTYGTIRLVGNLVCNSGDCPTLHDWTVVWSEGLVVSGTAKQYDQTTNVTSGTVAVAVNGVLQSGKTGTISGGVWSIPNVTFFPGDTVTVWIDGAADANEAVAVTKYDGVGDMSGLELYERHLSIGSNDATTTTNIDLSRYDNSVSGDEDIFHDVDGSNDLTACVLSGCSDVRLYVRSGAVYRPDSASSGNITTHDLEIAGTLTADGNTITVSGSWENWGTFSAGTSHVRMSATSGVETITDGTATSTFYRLTFGVGSGSALWEPQSHLDINDDLAVSYGTLGDAGDYRIALAGSLSIGANGVWVTRTATTTFDGTGADTWTDSTAAKQDLGPVLVNGTSKTITLASSVAATTIIIGTDDILNAGGANTIRVSGNWDNDGTFTAQTGTVQFSATSTGRTIDHGTSNFYNLTFDGVGGEWSFILTNATTTNTFSIATGTVTLPSGTLAVGANFDNTGGTFIPGSGTVRMTSTAGGRTVRTSGIAFNTLQFAGAGGAWSFPEGNATTSAAFAVVSGTVTLPSGTLVVGEDFTNFGTLVSGSGTVRMTAASGSRTLRFGGSSLANLEIAGAGTFTITDTNATTTADVVILAGTLVFPSANFGIGGSFLNSGTFTAGTSRVLFAAGSGSKTINPGASAFYDVNISGAGNFTFVANATATNAFTLTSAGSFTLDSGRTLAVGGTFTNLVGGASTTWTGSSLSLTSGTRYTINTKTQGADAYETITTSSGTHVRMWNSTVNVAAMSGSLYSQDDGGVDGLLHIYGQYVLATGTDHWSYATDFDGTALGSPRPVSVRFASGAGATYSQGATVRIQGAAGATTTIDRIATGNYSVTIVDSVIDARYYRFDHTDAAGLSLLGSTTILSLDDGDFDLDATGGTTVTIASTTVARNAGLQIFRVRFGLGSAASGSNVTEIGTTGSTTQFIRFKQHYGNIAGEGFDSDGGNPGDIRWDDSQFIIQISGTVYEDAGVTPMGAPVCDDVTPVVRVKVDGIGNYAAPCSSADGTFTVSGVMFQGDTVMTIFLDTNGGARAVTITKSAAGDLSDIRLYRHRVMLRHEDVSPITIADMGAYHAPSDSDIPFTVSTSGPNTLDVSEDTELWIWQGKTFIPGGDVSLIPAGTGNLWDAKFHIDNNATFTGASGETHTIGGNWQADSGATFTSGGSTFVFTATSSKAITALSPITFQGIRFNGSGGAWTLAQDMQVNGAFLIDDGTVLGTANVTVNGSAVTGAGTIAMTGGTFQMASGGTFGGPTDWSFWNLTFAGSAATTTKTGSSTVTVGRILSVFGSHHFAAGTSSAWVFTGSSTPFSVAGTFDAQRAVVRYAATGTTVVTPETYWRLWLAPAAAGSPTYTLGAGTFTVRDALVFGDGTNAVTVTAATNDPALSVFGDVHIRNGATFIGSDATPQVLYGNWENDGTFTSSNGTTTFAATSTGRTIASGGSSFGSMLFESSAGGWTIVEHATATQSFVLASSSSFTLAPGATLAVGGKFTNRVGGAATNWNGSTLKLYSGTTFEMNEKNDAGDRYDALELQSGTHARVWNSSATTTLTAVTASLYSRNHDGASGDLYIFGNFTNSSGSEYWSYGRDFDGTDISTTTPRPVRVRFAPGASATFSGGSLEILGAAGATTTVDRQSTGSFGLTISGGSTTIRYMSMRNANVNGLQFSGTPTVHVMDDADFELGTNTGSAILVAASVIDANPLRIFLRNRFATTTAAPTGYNVQVTGTAASAWSFDQHTGDFSGEAYDLDPGGDPGYIIWDDSAARITISGNVYADEGKTPIGAPTCDGVTQNVRLRVQGGVTNYLSACDPGTGAYSISNIDFNPGEVLTVFLDTNGGARAANVTVDPVTNIGDMHLYQNRVIVRHEDLNPITIADLDAYDEGNDSDIPFRATLGSPDTLSLRAGTGLIVWDGKTFAPGGDVTLHANASAAPQDGTLRLAPGAVLSGSNRVHRIGGHLLVDSGASIAVGSTTMIFTASTTGKLIAASSTQTFGSLTFVGSGGGWDASGVGTSTGDVSIQAGAVTLPPAILSIGASFDNSGGSFVASGNTLRFYATSTNNSIRSSGSALGALQFEGGGGTWRFADVNATTTGSISIATGTVHLPSGTLAIGGDFLNTGGLFSSGSGLLRFTPAGGSYFVRFGGSSANDVQFAGSSTFAFLDVNATSTGDFLILAGTTTLPQNSLAVGGNFLSLGVFDAGTSTVSFTATSGPKTVDPRNSVFGNILVAASGSGGISISGNATTTGSFELRTAPSFTLASGTTLAVGGTFTNAVGGAGTTWTGSTLSLFGGSFSMNTKTAGGDGYGYLRVSSSTHVRSWNSSSTAVYTAPDSSWYSQDHGAVDGSLYIYGNYSRSSGADYWSYAKDFDGTILAGGARRQVNVRFADAATSTFTNNATLEIVGDPAASTTIDRISSGTFDVVIDSSIFTAQYHVWQNLGREGLNLRGTTTLSTFLNGDFTLGISGGSMITISSTTIAQNASGQYFNFRFATTTGVTGGANVRRVGTTTNAITFQSESGNFSGEAFDEDGGDACGSIRWTDSSCLFVDQSGYRWRNDDGGEAAPNNAWYNQNWTKRQRVRILNTSTTSLSDVQVRLFVSYDTDMQSDFDDLRFTDSSGTTSIPYWIESIVASASSSVWVRVPSIGPSSFADIYMYYGNSGATNQSSGTSTFAFFDDFEDGSLSEYTGDTALFEVSTAFNYERTYGLDASVGNETAQTTDGIGRTNLGIGRGTTFRFFQYIDMTNGGGDETCTLFAVNGTFTSNQNYAVCLEPFQQDKLIIAKNVSSNDNSGTQLASVNVTYATGWYEVQVDWLASGRIDATVYDSTGAFFASTTAVDLAHTTGGIGFSFWGQHGGWDAYFARTYYPSKPTVLFGVEQGKDGATWKATENTVLGDQVINETVRLRLSVKNSGTNIVDQDFRLQVAPKGAAPNCESVQEANYQDVPTQTGGCGSSPACMVASSYFSNRASTTQLLSIPQNFEFSQGQIVEDPSNETLDVDLASGYVTEVEYALQMTPFASGNAYCFRTTNAGTPLDNYSKVAEMRILQVPSISNWSFNMDQNIALTEGTTTRIYATGTVTDFNGYTDLVAATSTFYRSGISGGRFCAADQNNCYQIASTSCNFLNCSGNSCELSCSAFLQYFADPTDIGSTYAGEIWDAFVDVWDTSGSHATASSSQDVYTLQALTVPTAINYGSLLVGSDTGNTNATTSVTNTGNSLLDLLLTGTDMSAGASNIPAYHQRFATTSFTYSSCSPLCTPLASTTTIPVPLGVEKPTTTAAVWKDVLWGIGIPTGTAATTYSGVNTFLAD